MAHATTTRLYVGTDRGLAVLQVGRDLSWERLDAGAFPWPVLALAPHPDDQLAALAGPGGGRRGLFRTRDGGRSWEPVAGWPDREAWWLGYLPGHPEVVLAGTTPGEAWRSDDGGSAWTELAGLRDVPGRERWTFPAPPHRPHVTSIAVAPDDPTLWLASVEVGGLLRSHDGGRSWEPIGSGLDRDVHQVAFWPTDPRVVFAGTGNGLYQSVDGGETWRRVMGRYATRLRVAGEGPALFAMVEGVGSPVQVTEDAGATWEPVGRGLPDGSFGDYGLEVDPADPARLYFGVGDPARPGRGALFASQDRGATWRRLEADLARVKRLAAVAA